MSIVRLPEYAPACHRTGIRAAGRDLARAAPCNIRPEDKVFK